MLHSRLSSISAVRQKRGCCACLTRKLVISSKFSQAILSRGVQHASLLVCYVTLSTLARLLGALDPLMADLKAALRLSASSALDPVSPDTLALTPELVGTSRSVSAGQIASDWAALVRKLQASVRSRLPDPQALMALYGQLEAHATAVLPAAAMTAVAVVDLVMEEGDAPEAAEEGAELDVFVSAEALRAEVRCSQ